MGIPKFGATLFAKRVLVKLPDVCMYALMQDVCISVCMYVYVYIHA